LIPNNFEGRKIVLATMHHKEKVIGPILAQELGLTCFVPDHFDTDVFGTFSGEISRENNALTTVRAKCLAAMVATHSDIGIASEGSFGQHPNAGFVAANDEIVLLIDQKNDLEITGRSLSLNTNFFSKEISQEKELWDFAAKANFPSHGLLLRSKEIKNFEVRKGIVCDKELIEQFRYFQSKYESFFVETDMRAMYNPTRMEVIAQATRQLVKNIKSCCPQCQIPGFTVVEVRLGLPCSWCKSPTESVKSHIYSCSKCQYATEVWYPHQKKTEDPTYCNYCNP
jgi:hypothetical protein